MPIPENEQLRAPEVEAPQEAAQETGTLAPAWHTVLLLAGILAASVHGAQIAGMGSAPNRLSIYAMTAVLELAMLGWVAFGMRLRGIPLRSLLGSVRGDARSWMQDIGVALVFWMAVLMILGSLGLIWSGMEEVVMHRKAEAHAAHPLAPSPSQQEAIRAVAQLAPGNATEIAGWILLCALAGFVEEVVFRGYLQRQFTAWASGGAAAGVVFSALAFGAAHGYQGVRNMALLAVFGVLFSLLALFRRSLRSCIFAHSWHDLVAGLAVAALRSHHLI